MRAGERSAPRRVTRRQFLAAGGAAAALIGARRSTPAAWGGPAAGILRIARGGRHPQPRPACECPPVRRIVLYTLYEPLIDADCAGNFYPVLARAWEVGSTGLVVTFHLRPGVVFHDGTPFTADVVKWNIERVLDPATGSEHRTRDGFQYLATAPWVALAPGAAVFFTVFVFNQAGEIVRDLLDPRTATHRADRPAHPGAPAVRGSSQVPA